MSEKKHVQLYYLDSSRPGTVLMRLPGNVGGHRMTIHEAAELSEQLRDAVRASGYRLVARKRRP